MQSQQAHDAIEGGRRYKPREPRSTLLHQVVREHLDAFLSYTTENYAKPLPKYVEREFRKYLPCGDPRQGFARVRSRKCKHEFFVAWSCKVRGVCPSLTCSQCDGSSVGLGGARS